MLKIRRLKSFTISEMLVVLVLTGIVISMAVLVLGIVQKQFRYIERNQGRASEWQLLERTLWHDFNSLEISYDNKTSMLWATSYMDSVKYLFKGTKIIRNQDTLNIQIEKMELYLEGNLVKGGAIDAMLLIAPKSRGALRSFVSKTKDASFYIKNNNLWLSE